MKVIGVYDKNNIDKIVSYDELVMDKMREFFKKYSREYSKNFRRNLATLLMLRVDEFENNCMDGEYVPTENIIRFTTMDAVSHEILHMASYDSKKKMMPYSRDSEVSGMGLLEGMTQHLQGTMYEDFIVRGYFLPTFCANMISNVPGIIKNYFVPNFDEFLKLFSNRKDILSLIYSLDYYTLNEGLLLVGDKIDTDAKKKLLRSMYGSLESVIKIERSFIKNSRQDKIFQEKFMDLISAYYIRYAFCRLDKNYMDKAYKLVRKKG